MRSAGRETQRKRIEAEITVTSQRVWGIVVLTLTLTIHDDAPVWTQIHWSRAVASLMLNLKPLDADRMFYFSIYPLSRFSFVCVKKLSTFCFPICLSEYPCSGMLGMVSGLINDNQITASSHTDRSWVPENARLLTSRTGWTLLPQPQPFTNEWLQVDLGEEKLVRGLIIQGGKHRENKVFMKKFRLGYSNNGSDWRMVLDTSGNRPKVGFSLLPCTVPNNTWVCVQFCYQIRRLVLIKALLYHFSIHAPRTFFFQEQGLELTFWFNRGFTFSTVKNDLNTNF